MTDQSTPAPADAEYLIRKGGYYYRPNAKGYIISVQEAGRYTLAEAISYSHPNGPDGPRDGISYELAPTKAAPADLVEAVKAAVKDAMYRTPGPADYVYGEVAKAALATVQTHMASDGIVQEDRDAAADVWSLPNSLPSEVVAGVWDKHYLVQAFAAHRRAAAVGRGASIQCVGCEGRPAAGNDPCAICGGSGQLHELRLPQPGPRDAEIDWLREALDKALQFACLTLAFIGRDRGSSRMETTLTGLCDNAKILEAEIRAALAKEGK